MNIRIQVLLIELLNESHQQQITRHSSLGKRNHSTATTENEYCLLLCLDKIIVIRNHTKKKQTISKSCKER